LANLYQTSKESKALEIEESARGGLPFRIVITLKKLGVVTMLDYFLSSEEADGIVKVLGQSASHGG